MSIAEIERFAAALKSNEALRAEAGNAQPETSQATPMDVVVAFAATKGYAFTADDVKAYAKARELADAELDGVAGGADQSLSDRAADDLKAKNLFLQQTTDILATLTRLLNATIQSTAKSIKGS